MNLRDLDAVGIVRNSKLEGRGTDWSGDVDGGGG
jgi:hypothetical protein